MKKLIYSSLFAMLLLSFCQNKTFAQVVEDNTIYSFVAMKHPPTYPGGIDALYKFLGTNITYPEMAVKNNVQGSVLASFVVDKDGSLTDIKIDRSLGSGTDEEAIRVLKASKRWNPGLLNGKAVKVKYNMPIKFVLAGKNAKKTNTITAPDPIKHKENVAEGGVYSFTSLKNPPTYPGGFAELYKFLGANIKYPTEAKDNKIQGKVLVSFVVQKDGSLADIKVERKLGYGTDEEAVRVLKLSKSWDPGMLDGKPVKVKYNIPISFNLAKSN